MLEQYSQLEVVHNPEEHVANTQMVLSCLTSHIYPTSIANSFESKKLLWHSIAKTNQNSLLN